jgi:hypothetical protein
VHAIAAELLDLRADMLQVAAALAARPAALLALRRSLQALKIDCRLLRDDLSSESRHIEWSPLDCGPAVKVRRGSAGDDRTGPDRVRSG